jgi:hypothetical protein
MFVGGICDFRSNEFGWQNLPGYWRIRGILYSLHMGQIGIIRRISISVIIAYFITHGLH